MRQAFLNLAQKLFPLDFYCWREREHLHHERTPSTWPLVQPIYALRINMTFPGACSAKTRRDGLLWNIAKLPELLLREPA